MKAILFDIKRFAIHDGPGIRTTVFFKGCPLTCPWCHNPESRGLEIEDYIHIDKIGDTEFKSLKSVGRLYTVDELMEEVCKDMVFFKESDGGITCSGGEPMLHSDFLFDFLKKCTSKDVHIALDTSGFTEPDDLKRIAPFVDLFLYDIKLLNNTLHLKYTGKGNGSILENFDWLIHNGYKVIGRIPVIPGINGDRKYMSQLATYLGDRLCPNFEEVHLLPYHRIGYHKHIRFGINGVRHYKEPTEKMMDSFAEIFKKRGFKIKIGG